MSKEIAIITYPRCGSTYLYWLLSSRYNLDIKKFHLLSEESILNIEEYKNKISVVRDPNDAIASLITMESFYYRSEQSLDQYLAIKIPERINDYINFYNTAFDQIDIIFKYEQINNYRDKLINFITEKTNFKVVNQNYIDIVHDNKKHFFLRTSTKSEEYQYIHDKINDYDLSQCYLVYNKCLNKAIDLSTN